MSGRGREGAGQGASRVVAADAALLVIDAQERLAAAMPADPLAQLERSVAILVEAAGRFGIPVVVSEQYPRGLGPTVAAVARALAPLGEVHRLEKLEFSVCAAPEFAAIRTRVPRRQWIVAGMETHICVYQTARDLLEEGREVLVVRDAVCSRFRRNFETGLRLMERAGAAITTAETVVFDLLGRAGTDDFKAISRLVR